MESITFGVLKVIKGEKTKSTVLAQTEGTDGQITQASGLGWAGERKA